MIDDKVVYLVDEVLKDKKYEMNIVMKVASGMEVAILAKDESQILFNISNGWQYFETNNIYSFDVSPKCDGKLCILSHNNDITRAIKDLDVEEV